MGVLRSIEHRIESLVEGAFGRAFRSHVQPVELARKLAKEMDDHKTVSVSRVYVPNEYVLYLSPADRSTAAARRARDRALRLPLRARAPRGLRAPLDAARPARGGRGPRGRRVRDRDADGAAPAARGSRGRRPLGAGARAAGRRPPAPPVPPVVPRPRSARRRSSSRRPPTPPRSRAADAEELGLARTPAVLVDRRQAPRADPRHDRARPLAECDITVDDANISRRHAEIRREDGAFWIVDLGSTNGIEVNGRRVERRSS